MSGLFCVFVLLDKFTSLILLFQDMIPGHDEGDPNKQLTR
jgi:hypothetical protein